MWFVLILPIQRGCGREAQSRQPNPLARPSVSCSLVRARARLGGHVRVSRSIVWGARTAAVAAVRGAVSRVSRRATVAA